MLILDFRLLRIWEQLQNSDAPPPKEDLAKWEAEFNQIQNAQREDDYDYGAGMQSAWESGLGNYDEDEHQADGLTFDDSGLPVLGPYQFGMLRIDSICFFR